MKSIRALAVPVALVMMTISAVADPAAPTAPSTELAPQSRPVRVILPAPWETRAPTEATPVDTRQIRADNQPR
jgi:hypothetical protein